MSWCVYAVNKTRRVHVEVGRVQVNDFDELSNRLVSVLNDSAETVADLYDINIKKVIDLTVDDISKITHALDNYCKFMSEIENVNIEAVFLYRKWIGAGDVVELVCDPELINSVEI